MTSDRQAMKEKIPLYVNGRLPEAEIRELEERLAADAELAEKLAEFEEIAALYPDVEKQVPYPDEKLQFARIQQRIGTTEPRRSTAPFRADWRERLTAFLGSFFGSPRLAWSLAAVQMALLLVVLWSPIQSRTFVTLSGGEALQDERRLIQVVFDEDARMKEVRELLSGLDAELVSGPRERGLYRIAVQQGRPLEPLLRSLEESGIVRLAQPVYTAGGE
jgi:anti-sigma factor RsiW